MNSAFDLLSPLRPFLPWIIAMAAMVCLSLAIAMRGCRERLLRWENGAVHCSVVGTLLYIPTGVLILWLASDERTRTLPLAIGLAGLAAVVGVPICLTGVAIHIHCRRQMAARPEVFCKCCGYELGAGSTDCPECGRNDGGRLSSPMNSVGKGVIGATGGSVALTVAAVVGVFVPLQNVADGVVIRLRTITWGPTGAKTEVLYNAECTVRENLFDTIARGEVPLASEQVVHIRLIEDGVPVDVRFEFSNGLFMDHGTSDGWQQWTVSEFAPALARRMRWTGERAVAAALPIVSDLSGGPNSEFGVSSRARRWSVRGGLELGAILVLSGAAGLALAIVLYRRGGSEPEVR